MCRDFPITFEECPPEEHSLSRGGHKTVLPETLLMFLYPGHPENRFLYLCQKAKDRAEASGQKPQWCKVNPFIGHTLAPLPGGCYTPSCPKSRLNETRDPIQKPLSHRYKIEDIFKRLRAMAFHTYDFTIQWAINANGETHVLHRFEPHIPGVNLPRSVEDRFKSTKEPMYNDLQRIDLNKDALQLIDYGGGGIYRYAYDPARAYHQQPALQDRPAANTQGYGSTQSNLAGGYQQGALQGPTAANPQGYGSTQSDLAGRYQQPALQDRPAANTQGYGSTQSNLAGRYQQPALQDRPAANTQGYGSTQSNLAGRYQQPALQDPTAANSQGYGSTQSNFTRGYYPQWDPQDPMAANTQGYGSSSTPNAEPVSYGQAGDLGALQSMYGRAQQNAGSVAMGHSFTHTPTAAQYPIPPSYHSAGQGQAPVAGPASLPSSRGDPNQNPMTSQSVSEKRKKGEQRR